VIEVDCAARRWRDREQYGDERSRREIGIDPTAAGGAVSRSKYRCRRATLGILNRAAVPEVDPWSLKFTGQSMRATIHRRGAAIGTRCRRILTYFGCDSTYTQLVSSHPKSSCRPNVGGWRCAQVLGSGQTT
jgi:hypothetical protein